MIKKPEDIFLYQNKISYLDFDFLLKEFNFKLNYKIIHIVGTNGKGSLVKTLSDNLIASNYNVASFSSPHLISVCERIKINNKNINEYQLLDIINNLFKINRQVKDLGFFHLLFLAALYYFETQKIDILILEAGIGAQFDCTNLISSNICLLSSISIDHENLLGNSINKIANNKAYAIKNNNSCYFLSSQDKLAKEEFFNRAKKIKNKNLVEIQVDKNLNIYEQNFYFANYVLKNEFDIEAKIKKNEIGRATSIIINNLECILDVSHNEDGIKKTLEFLAKKNNYDQIVVSFSSDKNINKMLKFFSAQNTYVYENQNKRALKLIEYPIEYKRVWNLSNFLKTLDKKTLFIGSFYFISEILKEYKIE